MQMIDTHAHLELPTFENDLDDVIQRARSIGVSLILCVGTTVESSRQCLDLAERYPAELRATAGIHPHYSDGVSAGEWDVLHELARRDKVVAVGETGLDFHREHSDRHTQMNSFQQHISLALDLHKPLIVHARKADEDVIQLLESRGHDLRGVRHCFDSSAQIAMRYVELGFHVAFGGLITREGHKKLKRAARKIPDQRLLLETDSPYMIPRTGEGRRNEPAYLKNIVTTLAELRETTPARIAEITTANAHALFELDG